MEVSPPISGVPVIFWGSPLFLGASRAGWITVNFVSELEMFSLIISMPSMRESSVHVEEDSSDDCVGHNSN